MIIKRHYLYLFSLLIIALWQSPTFAATGFPYIGCFELASRKHSIDLDLLLAVAAIESNWDADARSDADAHGIMQIRWPVTAKYLGAARVAELYNPCLNIDLGAGYLAELSRRFDGDLVMTLAAYNYGPSRLHTRRDIPPRVNGYVEKVLQRRVKIAEQMHTTMAPLPIASTDSLTVMRFNSETRAKAYIKSIVTRVPIARFSITKGVTGQFIVSLDTKVLDVNTRFRLAKFIPDLNSVERR
jgi:hypothetical protein